MRRDLGSILILSFIAAATAAAGCGEPPEAGDDAIETVARAYSSTTYVDDSAAPVHIQVKICTSDPAEHPAVDCTVDNGFAVVGGGAWAQWTGPGAMLTESYPKSDGRTWHGASKDHVWYDSHRLEVYAIGLRLDGINAEVLRGTVVYRHQQWLSKYLMSRPYGTASPKNDQLDTPTLLGGGAAAVTSGPGQLLTSTWPGADGATWFGSSQSILTSSPGQIMVHALGLQAHQLLLRGFGLDIAQRSGTWVPAATGVGSSAGSVSPGWALAGIAGQVSITSGNGRMLTRVGIYRGPSYDGPRAVLVESKDHGDVTSGNTIAGWTEVRQTPGSHGICNAGGPLGGSTADPCVANVCAQDPYCCQYGWDGICVGEVGTICGESCADYSCSAPSPHLSFWNDGTAAGSVQSRNNCYNYATNTRTDSNAEPGRYSGAYCVLNVGEDFNSLATACFDAAAIGKFATNDGLIPTTLAQGCSDGRSLIALAIQPGWDYHWYRQDANGYWSHKRGPNPAKTVDESGLPITNPETANRGPYTQFGGYFCTCSSSTEGQGHAVIR